MDARRIRRPLLGLICVLLFASVFQTEAAVRVVSASTCKGISEPGTLATNPTDRFPPETTEIHAVVVLADAKLGTKVRGAWISVDAIDVPNYEIRSTEVTVAKAGESRVHFSLANKSFPPGNYQLKISVDGQAAVVVPFVVTRAAAPVAASPPKAAAPAPKPAPQTSAPAPMSRLGAAVQAPAASPAGSLLGTWQAQGPYGIPITLVFQSASQLVLADEPLSFSLVPGALRMIEEGRPVDYPYSVQGDQLVLGMPEGGQLQFRKVSASTTPQAPYGGQQGATGYPGGYPSAQGNTWGQGQGYPGGYPQQGYPGGQGGYGAPGSQGGYGNQGYGNQGGGNEWQVQGRFCTYGGSSGGGSSYSRTGWAQFDGQGNFSYGSESSFSSGAGMGYGGGPGGGGRYRVQGNVVLLQFSDGSQGQARVNMQQNDGRITELYYGSDLYSPALCE
jgi:hypothetical protein